jgi:ribosomal subunit interface protein
LPAANAQLDRLAAAGALLVALPVFLQAPWVRLAPFSAALFTLPLLLLGVVLEQRRHQGWSTAGALLVGFSGSWLGGCLFWGWCRLHPLWHLPIEAFALPLALAGLKGRWRLAASFYLASLLGTACTDGVMAVTGVMRSWTSVLLAPLDQAPLLLQQVLQLQPPVLHLLLTFPWARPPKGFKELPLKPAPPVELPGLTPVVSPPSPPQRAKLALVPTRIEAAARSRAPPPPRNTPKVPRASTDPLGWIDRDFIALTQQITFAFLLGWGHSELQSFQPESIRRLFMNLTISGHHLEVTPALRSYVTTKLDRIMRHFDKVVDVKVLLTIENQKEKERRQRAECNIRVKGSDMFAQSAHADLYAAVDELVDKLDRQVVRHKGRLQNHHHEAPKRLM